MEQGGGHLKKQILLSLLLAGVLLGGSACSVYAGAQNQLAENDAAAQKVYQAAPIVSENPNAYTLSFDPSSAKSFFNSYFYINRKGELVLYPEEALGPRNPYVDKHYDTQGISSLMIGSVRVWSDSFSVRQDGKTLQQEDTSDEDYWDNRQDNSDGPDIYGVDLVNSVNMAKKWDNLLQLIAFEDFFVGLKKDGTVIHTIVGEQWNPEVLDSWKDIVKIDTLGTNVIGLMKNGRVVIADVYRETPHSFDLSEMNEAVDIVGYSTVSGGGVAALRKDGTIVTTQEESTLMQRSGAIRLFDSIFEGQPGVLTQDGYLKSLFSDSDWRKEMYGPVDDPTNLIDIKNIDGFLMGLWRDGSIHVIANVDGGEMTSLVRYLATLTDVKTN